MEDQQLHAADQLIRSLSHRLEMHAPLPDVAELKAMEHQAEAIRLAGTHGCNSSVRWTREHSTALKNVGDLCAREKQAQVESVELPDA